MKLPVYQVDAFSRSLFGGNPAAVVPLQEWLPEGQMQHIAMENNLSETAFFVPQGDGFELRWFTPVTEVALCGHATLATAHVLFNELDYKQAEVSFYTQSGELKVRKNGRLLAMDFPAASSKKVETPGALLKALGNEKAIEVFKSDDYLVVFGSEKEVAGLQPDFAALQKVDARGIIVTAKGNKVDFVSRFFAPKVGVNEDPVTGSAHTKLIPYWSSKLGKNELRARQISPRGGEVYCKMRGSRVEISGEAITYLTGEIRLA